MSGGSGIRDFRARRGAGYRSGLRVKRTLPIPNPLELLVFPVELVSVACRAVLGLLFSPIALITGRPLAFFGFLAPIGSLICVGLLFFLLFFPQALESNVPGWRSSLGYTGLAFALFGLFSSCWRCLRVLAVVGFWAFASYTVGAAVFGVTEPPDMAKRFRQSGTSQSIAQQQIKRHGLQYVSIPESAGRPPAVLQSISAAADGASSYSLNLDGLNPSTLIGKAYGDVQKEIDAGARAVTDSVKQAVYAPVADVMKGLNISGGAPSLPSNVTETLTGPSGLPDSAYFPTGALKGRKFYRIDSNKSNLPEWLARWLGK